MRILWHSVSPFIGSGYGKVTRYVTRGLAELGHKVIISAYYGVEPGGLLTYQDIPILASKEGPFGVLSAAKFAKLYRSDLQILHTDWWAFSKFPELMSYPVLYGPMDHIFYPEEIIEFTKKYKKLIALSKWQRDELKSRWGLDSDVIYHGVDLSIYKPMNKEEVKKEFNLEDKFIFGTVAANNDKEDRKFHSGMIKAMYWFLQENPDVKDVVWLYHTDSMSARGMPLSRIVHKWGLDEIVKFKDPNLVYTGISEQEMARLYNAMDVHLLCSKREGFGMPILESMACKVPNIVHEFSAPKELVKGRGWIVKSLTKDLNLQTTPINAETAIPDVYDLADKIKRAYFKDKEREKYSKLARKFAIKYSWQRLILEEWEPLLSSIEDELKSPGVSNRRIL